VVIWCIRNVLDLCVHGNCLKLERIIATKLNDSTVIVNDVQTVLTDTMYDYYELCNLL